MAKQYVYSFGPTKCDGDGSQKALLGGKGANLADMVRLGLPVPPGFTISTDVCTYFYANKRSYPAELKEQATLAIAALEKDLGATGMKFGDRKNPLLVSVRSGAPVSMPGMMDTVLNLGLNDQTVEGLIEQSKDARFAYDSYRRFVMMYCDVVLNVNTSYFETALEHKKADAGVELDTELTAEQLKSLVKEFKMILMEQVGLKFPEDPLEQLWGAIGAVFGSWVNPRANTYRKINGIPESIGTAVTVQAMVYGNMGDDCATGVAFTRDPSTGAKKFFGEFLINAQGEDVVAGIRTPQPINADSFNESNKHLPTLDKALPPAYADLVKLYQKLETHYRDMQDIEFTIQKGKLFMLQTRTGKRTAAAAVKIATDMVQEGLIDKKEAVLRVTPEQLDQFLHPRLDPKAVKDVLCRGLPASPGAVSGKIVLDPDKAEKWVKEKGEKVILVRVETSPEDIHGMHVAEGILTARGGMTCVAPETLILTDQGFLTAEQGFELLEEGKNLRILSFDSTTMKPAWKNIIAAGRKPSQVLRVSVSQTGGVEENELRLTADHKMFTLENRQLIKKPLRAVLDDSDFVSVVGRLPGLVETETSPSLAYVAGALLSDGCIRLWDKKGSVTFIQKPTPEKADFIAAVEQSFLAAFGVPFSYVRERTTESELKGRVIKGSVEDRICFRRDPAERLAAIRDNLTAWVLTLSETALRQFLAGYIDGDGTYAEESSAVRLQISVTGKRPHYVRALSLACLRLGIVPQVCANRENWTIQIAENVELITAFTNRVRPEIPPRHYESRCLSVKGLFGDIVDQVNFMGRVREGIKRELMFGVEKIRRDVLPLCSGESARQLKTILDSDLRSFRIKESGTVEQSLVYNFEVEASEELDKNYIVFSSRMTPVLISNSHAAVVARGMGKTCVAGCSAVKILHQQGKMIVGNREFAEGEWITLDGTTGEVIAGKVPTITPELSGSFKDFMVWVDEMRKLKVRTNADTPADAKVARTFGAEGIGLCRTEHMFFDPARIGAVRQMILSDSVEERERALAKLLPMQREDFYGLFKEMKGLPVTIRLLDPPLHEFLPHKDEDVRELAKDMEVPYEALYRRKETLHEFNPMLGHRGCRLGISYPEIYLMQVRAIVEAACELKKKEGQAVEPEIMIPLVSDWRELQYIRAYSEKEIKKVFAEQGVEVPYTIGTMIELPRAALTADQIAASDKGNAEFFSFGTNDLTQTTFGLSRDDSASFLGTYVDRKVFKVDPFVSIDVEGVGELMKLAVQKGKGTRGSGMKMGICGEQGGEPKSVHFCHKIGLDYVSCSPYRVPIARLAAAHAALLDT